MRNLIVGLIVFLAPHCALPATAAEFDWQKVDSILNRSSVITDNVHRYGLARADLQVSLDGVAIKPAFALGGWIAFQPMGEATMMMGDLVLTETEINPVMSKLLEEGMQVTAVHNHLLRAAPATYYMHVAGTGNPEVLARAVRVALEKSKTPFDTAPVSNPAKDDLGIDRTKIDEAIGFKGRTNGGTYQFSVPRSDTIKFEGMPIAAAMGTAIAINFEPTGDGKAAITGDFVALASEVDPLIKTLRDNGIEVTAIHNHMLAEEPRAFFIHFWANDNAVKLAKGLRAALNAVHVAPNG